MGLSWMVCPQHQIEVKEAFLEEAQFQLKFFPLFRRFFFDLLSFEDNLSYKCQIGLKWKKIWLFFIQDQCSICGLSHFNIRTIPKEAAQMKKVSNQAQAVNILFTSNWCYEQTIQLRPMKFWHKKRQAYFYTRKMIPGHKDEASRRKSLILFCIWQCSPCISKIVLKMCHWDADATKYLAGDDKRKGI